MIKYVPEMTSVVVEEVPDMVTLAVDISNCQGNCIGCHSPFLKTDIGQELTPEIIDALIDDNYGVNCFLFLGEGKDRQALMNLADYITKAHGIKVALYSGRVEVEDELWDHFDYLKVGPYIGTYGPLNRRTTNQRLYKLTRENGKMISKEDITSRFWRLPDRTRDL